MGEAQTASAKSKQEARALAAKSVLSILIEKENPALVEKKQKSKGLKKKTLNISQKSVEKAQTKQQAKVDAKKTFKKNTKKSDKSTSPKKQSYQHKKHL